MPCVASVDGAQQRYLRSCETEWLLGVPAEASNGILKDKSEKLEQRETRRTTLLRGVIPRSVATFVVAAVALPTVEVPDPLLNVPE